MHRTLSPFIALAGFAAMLAPVAATAQGGAYYTAVAAEKPAKASLVTRNTVWRCADTVCTASKAADRDTILCELVARDLGTLTAFTANGTTFDAEKLAKCNARVR